MIPAEIRSARSATPLAGYLRRVGQVLHSRAGTPETSHYGALEKLLDAVGASLPQPVTAIMQLRNKGGGMPDGGFFDRRQLQAAAGLPRAATTASGRLFDGQPPTHGVIEAKGLDANLTDLARSAQVRRYLARYGKVLLTNYRQFTLVSRGTDGTTLRGETYTLSDTAEAFADLTRSPHVEPSEEAAFADYMRRVMEADAPIIAASDLAWFLAAYAKIALARVEVGDLAALDNLRKSLSETLGFTFRDEEGEHFFRSTLVQTLFYGAFSAWVLWSEQNPRPGATFSWRQASWSLDVPMVRALFDQVATPSNLGPLRLDEVLDWAGDALGVWCLSRVANLADVIVLG
jgi:hypothetical protein